MDSTGDIVIYDTGDGRARLDVHLDGETVWLTQAQMAELFGVGPQAITKYIGNIYDEGELAPEATRSKMEQVRTEGARQVRRTVSVYDLDMIVCYWELFVERISRKDKFIHIERDGLGLNPFSLASSAWLRRLERPLHTSFEFIGAQVSKSRTHPYPIMEDLDEYRKTGIIFGLERCPIGALRLGGGHKRFGHHAVPRRRYRSHRRNDAPGESVHENAPTVIPTSDLRWLHQDTPKREGNAPGDPATKGRLCAT